MRSGRGVDRRPHRTAERDRAPHAQHHAIVAAGAASRLMPASHAFEFSVPSVRRHTGMIEPYERVVAGSIRVDTATTLEVRLGRTQDERTWDCRVDVASAHPRRFHSRYQLPERAPAARTSEWRNRGRKRVRPGPDDPGVHVPVRGLGGRPADRTAHVSTVVSHRTPGTGMERRTTVVGAILRGRPRPIESSHQESRS